jgi:tRNA U55 pseudouridine synthase TruB
MHLLFKKQFETPKETIERYIKSGELPPKDTYTYAGRLDPLASGLLIVLDEASLARREEILNLPKTYEVEVLFGMSTDSFDLLGLVQPIEKSLGWRTLASISDKEKIDEKFMYGMAGVEGDMAADFDWSKLVGSYMQYYPFFSSKPVDGMPLFAYTKLHGIEETNLKLPSREVELFAIEKINERNISLTEIEHKIEEILMHVKGDFRQNEIAESWKICIDQNRAAHMDGYKVLTLKLDVSSGFYVRSFACWLGQKFGIGAIALSIKRIAVGEYKID